MEPLRGLSTDIISKAELAKLLQAMDARNANKSNASIWNLFSAPDMEVETFYSRFLNRTETLDLAFMKLPDKKISALIISFLN